MWSPKKSDEEIQNENEESAERDKKPRSSRIRRIDFGTEDSHSDFASEHRAKLLGMLKSLPSNDRQAILMDHFTDLERFNACAKDATRSLVVLYSNPRTPSGAGMLSLEGEMRTVLQKFKLMSNSSLVPGTTRGDFDHIFQKGKPAPAVVCFSGHANHNNQLELTDAKSAQRDPMDFTQFVECVRRSNPRPKLLLFFACLTGEFARLFNEKDDPHVIGWSSLVEDRFAQTFSNAVLNKLGTLLPRLASDDIQANEVQKLTLELFATGKGELESEKIGDPADELGDVEQHIAKFCENVRTHANDSYMTPEVKHLSYWKMQNLGKSKWLDFRSVIPGCTHCWPKKSGVPFLHNPFPRRDDGRVPF